MRPQGSHLLVDVTGVPRKAEMHGLFKEIRRRGEAALRTLIELRTEACLDVLDTLDVVSGIPSLGLPPGYRIALLITDDAMRPSAEFAETVAFNRGIAVRVFDERAPAERWLAG